MVTSTGDPILDAAEEINQIAERLRTSTPTVPRLPTEFWIGLSEAGGGFVSSSTASTTVSSSQQAKENGEDDACTPSESSDNEDSDEYEDALVKRTDALVAAAAGQNEHKFLSFFDSVHEDIVRGLNSRT